MHKPIAFIAASVLSVFAALPAGATVNKTWVSSTGSDTGTCQLVAPCKTFFYAMTQTSAGGELDVKDSGSYGGLTITQAISIVSGDGVLATVGVPPGGTGITVKAGAQDKVILRGLTIDGHGTGSDGIDFVAGMSLTVENCNIRNVTNVGLSLQPVGALLYSVSNTNIANAHAFGILIQPFNTSPHGSLSNLNLHDNGVGLFVGYVTTIVTGSIMAANGTGIGTEIGANVLLGQSIVSENTTYGIQTQGGTVTSYGDNDINGNATDISGSFGSISRR